VAPPQTIAQQLAAKQREISVAEFFERNRQILGFDNPQRALLTTVKEAVDNSLDACEEAGILPEILVEIVEVAPAPSPNQPSRFRVVVEDNGPGVVKPQIPKIFAKLLYLIHAPAQRLAAAINAVGRNVAVVVDQGVKENKFK
jgi:DNA topoisomerase-6 subunit B